MKRLFIKILRVILFIPAIISVGLMAIMAWFIMWYQDLK